MKRKTYIKIIAVVNIIFPITTINELKVFLTNCIVVFQLKLGLFESIYNSIVSSNIINNTENNKPNQKYILVYINIFITNSITNIYINKQNTFNIIPGNLLN